MFSHFYNMIVADMITSSQETSDELNPNYVFVGLNVAGNGELWDLPDWANFHSEYRTHNDFKLRYALKDTKYWGAYITDVIKRHSNSDGGQVMSYLKNHPEVVDANIKDFLEEIELLGTKPILVAMGGKVYKILSENLKGFTIIPIKHYSFTISKENCRRNVV